MKLRVRRRRTAGEVARAWQAAAGGACPIDTGVFVLPWVTGSRYNLARPGLRPGLTITEYREFWRLPTVLWLDADPPLWEWPA